MISVIIPAYNEEKTIAKCLDSLVGQTTAKPFEVIVVDNNCTDKTVLIAETYKNKLDLKIVHETYKGRGAARYAGFHAAKGTIIFSTDADAIVPSDWIEKVLPYFEDADISAVTGTGKITDIGTRNNILFNIGQPLAMRLYRVFFGHYWLSGFNFAIRKDIYEKAGGFRKTLNMQEDTDLSFKVVKFGTIQFIKNVPVTVSGRRFQKGIFNGSLPYITTFLDCFFFKKTDAVLSDVR